MRLLCPAPCATATPTTGGGRRPGKDPTGRSSTASTIQPVGRPDNFGWTPDDNACLSPLFPHEEASA